MPLHSELLGIRTSAYELVGGSTIQSMKHTKCNTIIQIHFLQNISFLFALFLSALVLFAACLLNNFKVWLHLNFNNKYQQ